MVDASKVDLDFVNPNEWEIGQTQSVQTLYASRDGRVYGQISLTYEGNNQFSIGRDYYNFEMHNGPGINIWARNQFTKIGSAFAGSGKPYYIYFNGVNTVYNHRLYF